MATEIPAPTTPVPSLTERQSEILPLIAQGLTNAEIGKALHLSEATVKTYVGSLLEVMGAASRAHAVALGFQWGLLTSEMVADPLPVRVSSEGVVVIRKNGDSVFPWVAWNLLAFTDQQVEGWTSLVPATNGGAL